MLVFLLFLCGVLAAICFATAMEADDNVLATFAGFGAFLFFAGFLVSMFILLSQADQAKVEKNYSLCTQIPTAQWISDNNTCIKDGKVLIP